MDEKPAFDPSQPFAPADKPPFDPSKPFDAGGGPHTGMGESALEGYLSGASANWRDEIRGASVASGLPEALGGFRAPIGAARLAYEHLSGEPGEATAEYHRAVDEIRARQKQMKAEHPYAYGAGELGGAATSMLAAPGLKATTFAGRMGEAALAGASYGAVAGAGEAEGGLGARGVGAATGAVEGAVAGPVGAVVGAGIEKAGKLGYDYFGRPIVSTIRGLRDPETEAARRTAGALTRDYPQVAEGKALGMSPTEWAAARAAGEPVIIGDMGAETTRALMRSAANTSPEGRNVINSVLQDRFQTQNERAGATIRSLVSGGANSLKTKAQLEAEYDLERGAAYGAAYADGDKPIWSPALERLTTSPTVAGALRGAINRWKDFQVRDGFGGMNPPVTVTPDGQLKFLGGQGMLPYPNLQLWDYALRNLAGMASAAKRAGNPTDAGLYGGLADQLKAALYKEVPKFADARGIAAKYFGGNSVIEAGEKALNENNVGKLKLAMAKMKPAEREMFQESYLDAYAGKVEGMGDRTDITGRIFNSPRERAKLAAVAGAQGLETMQAFLHRETIYDAARKALGNSTTVRQMIEAGLAGGGIGAYLSGGDPYKTMEAIGAGATLGVSGGASGLVKHSVTSLARSGAQKVIGYVDQNTAKRVAELLTSDDPRALMQGLRTAANNQRVADGLRNIARQSWAAVGARGGENVPLPPLQLPSPGRAEDDQQGIPRPPAQQQHGGRVDQPHPFAHGGRVSPSNINRDPSEAQKKAGNYAKDHVRVHGLDIAIENAKGAQRSGIDKGGKPWAVKMPAHYGYIKGTVGKDKDHIDCYLGPHIRSPMVYVVDQIDADSGKFDEHKCFLGFPSRLAAINTYHKAFSDGRGGERFGQVTGMPVEKFKQWLKGWETKKAMRYEESR